MKLQVALQRIGRFATLVPKKAHKNTLQFILMEKLSIKNPTDPDPCNIQCILGLPSPVVEAEGPLDFNYIRL